MNLQENQFNSSGHSATSSSRDPDSPASSISTQGNPRESVIVGSSTSPQSGKKRRFSESDSSSECGKSAADTEPDSTQEKPKVSRVNSGIKPKPLPLNLFSAQQLTSAASGAPPANTAFGTPNLTSPLLGSPLLSSFQLYHALLSANSAAAAGLGSPAPSPMTSMAAFPFPPPSPASGVPPLTPLTASLLSPATAGLFSPSVLNTASIFTALQLQQAAANLATPTSFGTNLFSGSNGGTGVVSGTGLKFFGNSTNSNLSASLNSGFLTPSQNSSVTDILSTPKMFELPSAS